MRVVIIIAAIVALLASGCAQVAEKTVKEAVEQAAGVHVDDTGETVTVYAEGGTTVVYSSDLTDELKGFPVPRSFELDSSGSMSSGDQKMTFANWRGTGSGKEVIDYYRETLPEHGWIEEVHLPSSDGGVIALTNADGHQLTMTVGQSGEDEINIAVLLANSAD